MKRCKHTTSTARSAFLRSSVLLSPLLFSSFPLLFSPLLLLYSRLGEETRPNDERTSLKLVSHKLRARKLVSEIRHFSQPLPPPLHSSLEHTGTLLRPYFSMGTYTSCTPPPCHGPLFSLSCYKPEENRKDRPLPRQKVDHEKSSYRANQEYPPHQLFFFSPLLTSPHLPSPSYVWFFLVLHPGISAKVPSTPMYICCPLDFIPTHYAPVTAISPVLILFFCFQARVLQPYE